MTHTSGKPDMHDPADRDIHSEDGVPPYPTPAKVTKEDRITDDTIDPADTTDGAPSDRAHVNANGQFERALQSQQKKLGDDVEDWKDGKTQDAPDTKRD